MALIATPEQRARMTRQALQHIMIARLLRVAYNRLAVYAADRFGNHGLPISGCYREHFPENYKATLRRIACRESHLWSVSVGLWAQAGRKRSTWFKWKKRIGPTFAKRHMHVQGEIK